MPTWLPVSLADFRGNAVPRGYFLGLRCAAPNRNLDDLPRYATMGPLAETGMRSLAIIRIDP